LGSNFSEKLLGYLLLTDDYDPGDFMKHIVCALAILTSMHANSATDLADKTITSIYTYESYAVVEFNEEQVNDQGCSNKKAVYIDLSNGNGKAMYSSVLSGATSGKKVSFKGNSGCDPDFNAVKIYRTRVKF
jgi:hypothetical protein